MALANQQENFSELFPQCLQTLFDPVALTCFVDVEVDARETPCPMPLLKAKQALRSLQPNQRIRVSASDAGSLKDFVSFADIAQHLITHFYADKNYYYYVLQKGPL